MQSGAAVIAKRVVWLLLFLAASSTLAGEELPPIPAKVPIELKRLAALRGKAYADANWPLLVQLDRIEKDLKPEDLPLKEKIAYYALVAQDRSKDLFRYRDRIVDDFLREAVIPRLKLLPDDTTQHEMPEGSPYRDRIYGGEFFEKAPLADKEAWIKIAGGRLGFGSLVNTDSGTSRDRDYL